MIKEYIYYMDAKYLNPRHMKKQLKALTGNEYLVKDIQSILLAEGYVKQKPRYHGTTKTIYWLNESKYYDEPIQLNEMNAGNDSELILWIMANRHNHKLMLYSEILHEWPEYLNGRRLYKALSPHFAIERMRYWKDADTTTTAKAVVCDHIHELADGHGITETLLGKWYFAHYAKNSWVSRYREKVKTKPLQLMDV